MKIEDKWKKKYWNRNTLIEGKEIVTEKGEKKNREKEREGWKEERKKNELINEGRKKRNKGRKEVMK